MGKDLVNASQSASQTQTMETLPLSWLGGVGGPLSLPLLPQLLHLRTDQGMNARTPSLQSPPPHPLPARQTHPEGLEN